MTKPPKFPPLYYGQEFAIFSNGCLIFLRTYSSVTLSIYEMFSIFLWHPIFNTCLLLSISAVYATHAYRNMDMTRVRISFSYEHRDKLSYTQMSLFLFFVFFFFFFFFVRILFESCISLTTFKTGAVVEWLERLDFVKSVTGPS